jgi:presequence protease
MQIEELSAYSVIEKREIKDLNSVSYLLKHKRTGARIALLSNDDDNKVFYIGFRTPPKNSTGVAHIIEHTVLCGSDKFPVKDPFIELAKGSLNTFLNAMTYPDKTVYPVASCNDKDFQNLMDVYLDAVFHPNIYHEEKIFKQEGWHYEMESEQDPLTINGVVYNEMKGAYSSPDDVLYREIMNSLYPHTAYAVESGGDPDVIPELTYEEFLDFHRKYYHPSNSYLYLYGDMDMVEKLRYIDEEYLSKYDALQVDSALTVEKPFVETVTVEKEYPIMESESEKKNSYLSYNVSLGKSLDRKTCFGFQVLVDVIGTVPGAKVKQAILDAGIGTDVICSFDSGVLQPYFSIIAKNADIEQKEEFVRIIEEQLQKLAEEGLDKKTLQATLNYYEFKYREADFGSYPKGLMYGLNMLESWLYDDAKPFYYIELLNTYRELKDAVQTSFYEDMIRILLLRNTHKSLVTVKPVKGLTGKKERKLAEALAAKKAQMSDAQIRQIVKETAELKEYQEEPSPKEDLEKIPLLTRADMRKEATAYRNTEKKVGDTVLLHHDVFTNGIGYLRFMFDLRQVPEELFPYVGILKILIGLVSTQTHSYGELYNEINLKTGGIAPAVNTYTDADDLSRYTATFDMKAKVLYENLKDAFALVSEILTKSCYTDSKRIFELIAEARSEKQAHMMSAGHTLAAGVALSYLSKPAMVMEQINGMPFYRMLEDLEEHFEERFPELSANLARLVECLFCAENLMIDYTSTEDGLRGVEELVEKFKKTLYTVKAERKGYDPQPQKRNEGLMSSAQVQYVCRAGNFEKKGLPYTGALRVLRVMMGYDYLWTQVRVKGGAYGCMCNFGKSGESYFVSYRDPNLEKTIEIYEKAADYIAGFEADERTMTQFIIGAVSELDTPMTPAQMGNYSLSGYMTHYTMERVQKDRDELLATEAATIRDLAAYIRAFMSDDCLCVVGNEQKIKEQKDLFLHTDYLFH